MNQFTGLGRLTRDVELKTSENNISHCSFTIAINRRYKNANGEYEADFISCAAWRGTAEFISKYFSKGRMIGVVGTLQTRTWTDKEGGKRYATEVIVEQAHFAGSKTEQERDASAAPPPSENDNQAANTFELPFEL